MLDTAAGVWCDKKAIVNSPRHGRYSQDIAGGDATLELTRRCRHAAASVGDHIYLYGGLRGGTPATPDLNMISICKFKICSSFSLRLHISWNCSFVEMLKLLLMEASCVIYSHDSNQ